VCFPEKLCCERETFALGFQGGRIRAGGASSIRANFPIVLNSGYAAKMFPSVEMNGTFYCLQRPESFAA